MKNIITKIKSLTEKPKDEKDKKDEVDEFLKNNPIFPCFLISKDNGKIDTIKDGFEKENIPIQKSKEHSFRVTYQESKEDFQMILDDKISEDISIYGTMKFEENIHRNKESNSSKKIFVGECIIYSFNIKEEDLSFSKYYIDKFKQISNSYLTIHEKATKLVEEIFNSTGFYIPKKIYIGGLMICRENQFSDFQALNSNVSLDVSFNLKQSDISLDQNGKFSSDESTKYNRIYHSQSTQIIGGDHSAKTFEDWVQSINLENSAIIECCNIIPAINILDNDLKQQLEIPLNLINERYLRRKNCLQFLNEISDEKLRNKKGYGKFNRGKCNEIDTRKEPRIKKESFSIFTDVTFFPPICHKEFYYQFNNIIIGFEIQDNRGDGNNGQWTIKNEPIGSKEISIDFDSCFLREQNFTINVYLMEIPN